MTKKDETINYQYNHEYDYKKQKAFKPTVETLVEQIMDEDSKRDFLIFINYLEQHNMSVRWFVTNSYNVTYKSCKIAQIYIYDGKDKQYRWRIRINTATRDRFDEFLERLNDEIKIIFLENFNNKKKCTGCSSCAPGKSFDFLSKHYENICDGSTGIRLFNFVNPDAKQMESIKKLIHVRKEYCVRMKSIGINPGT